ncbi:MAG: hypothetical protein R3F49_13945 [Planctomycetota bacterium]
MQTADFYAATKYCPCCDKNVRYLASIEVSYCVECGGEVRLFSAAEWTAFNATLEARKSKGGRPRSNFGRRAA